MGLLKAARGGVIDDLKVDWGTGEEVQVPIELDDDFEMVSESSEVAKETKKVDEAPLSLFGETSAEDKTDLGPQKAIVNLPPPPTIQQAPRSDKLPIPLYPGFRCSIFAIIKQTDNPGSHSPTIRITGKVLGREVVLQIPVEPISIATSSDAVEGGRLLHTLAAKALIQVFEDLPTSPEVKAEIERLGKRYTLASSVTSFLAIDEEQNQEILTNPQAEAAVQVQVTVEATRRRAFSPMVAFSARSVQPQQQQQFQQFQSGNVSFIYDIQVASSCEDHQHGCNHERVNINLRT